MLYSQDLAPYIGPLLPSVQQAVSEIKQYFGIDNPEVLYFDKWHIVVPATYKVSIPTNGAVDGIDINEEEPVLIRVQIEDYPNVAPFILSDRKNFPKNQLSHLYYSPPADPAKFCLVRNDPNEWFATIKMVDFLDVGGQWLYKAGAGLLNEDGNEFDPTRIEGNVFGKHLYKYDSLNEVVVNDERLIPDLPMAVLLAGSFVNKAKSLSYKSIKAIPFIALTTFVNHIQDLYVKLKDSKNPAHPLFSVLLWHPDNKIEELYLTSFPVNYGQLKTFFNLRGISIEATLEVLEKSGTLIKCGVPIIYAMKRPSKMIGYDGFYEFFNFVLTMPVEGVKALTDEAEVSIQGHTEPFSHELAVQISGQSRPHSALYIGAGSLGSKLIINDARSGNMHIGVVDNDDLMSHNLARHELFADSIGQNKAKAIIEHIKGFYTLDNTDNLNALEYSMIYMQDAQFNDYSLIIDSTASVQVRNNLVLRKLPEKLRYYKTEIADEGALGLLYAEGSRRNPRMDDLVNLTCFLATKDQELKTWRIADSKRVINNLNIGLGCSSATTVMANDIISYHASLVSQIIAKVGKSVSQDDKGFIYVNSFRENKGIPKISGQHYEIEPFELLECKAGSGWQLRCISGITERLIKLCNKHKPIETGGVLVGVANYKTKVIHVFDIITEPQDSKGSCFGFTRGTKGLPAVIDKIKHETGDVIGYIGEWHTHPMDLKRLSARDEATISDLKILNAQIPIPTCAVIVTPDQVLPFVFY